MKPCFPELNSFLRFWLVAEACSTKLGMMPERGRSHRLVLISINASAFGFLVLISNRFDTEEGVLIHGDFWSGK